MRFIFGELNQGAIGTSTVVLFSALFVGLVVWVFRRSGRSTYAKIERMPIDD